MKIHIFCFFFLSMVFFSCKDSPQDSKVTGNGHLYVMEYSKSFGEIHKTTKDSINCTYELNNTGDKTVVIHKIDVSCGCISANVSSRIIKPNDMAVLTIHINPQKQLGHFNKTVYVNSNADNSVLLLRIKGNIIE